MKRIFIFIVFLFCLGSNTYTVQAIVDPTKNPNNLYGIHIIDSTDLDDAAKLVNSSGGDWGYTTLVIRKDERNIKQWQDTFDKMRKLHLIPIVRIASRMTGEGWEKLTQDDIDSWVYFLNSLNWVVKNRYVIIGNEPNHASEWGNDINPPEYTNYLKDISKQLKDASDDFFVLPAGFDASAPNDKTHMDEVEYLKKMIETDKDIFNNVDGWTSHSYPNPNFSGSANDKGRGTVKTYDWELSTLKNLGINRNLPVFITETGWAHNMDNKIRIYQNTNTVAEKLRQSYESAWNDKRIIAVTPFLLNYQTPPFDIFSWKKKDGSYYDFYFDIQRISKPRGKPEQINSGQILAVLTPKVVKKGDRFYGIAYVKNTGQVVWERNSVTFIQNANDEIAIEAPFFADIWPGQKGFIFFSGLVNEKSSGEIKSELILSNSQQQLSKPFEFLIEITSQNLSSGNDLQPKLANY